MPDDARSRIKSYILSELMFDEDQAALGDDTPLLGSIVDSLGLVQLVAFLEGEFDIEIGDTDVTADNFRTLRDIERLVAGKVQAG